MSDIRKIELLAPARDLAASRIAIDYGADAVYMGAPSFGARHAADNSIGDIARAVSYAHMFGARLYIALNTLLFENELEDARKQAIKVIEAGADALIIQDMAYMEMGLKGVEFHASTQTANISPEKVKFLHDVGFARVILERNLSLDEIRKIKYCSGAELECFVHGAICVAHSGRCYMSRTMSDRSGNRGSCSQPCRMTYDLADETGKKIMEGKHLLSVRDLDLSDRIGELLDSGLDSFKIEGRLKDINYLKNTVAFYRKILDRHIAADKGLLRASSGRTILDFEPDPSKSFTRGRSRYFIDGPAAGVASFDTPKSLGEPIGKATGAAPGWVELSGNKTINSGDGICAVTAGGLVGTNVNRVEGKRIYTNKSFALPAGTEIYRNHDHAFTQMLDRGRTRRIIDVTVEVYVSNAEICTVFTDEDGNVATVVITNGFDEAKNPGSMEASARSQLSRGGETIFDITEVSLNGQVPFIPVSELNAIRREGLGKLADIRKTSIPQRKPFAEAEDIRYPYEFLGGADNVINSMAKEFYRRHGVESIEPGYDLRNDMKGLTVMTTRYCIRRETGMCMKSKPEHNKSLYLHHGIHRYRLEFDCGNCMMNIIYEGTNK